MGFASVTDGYNTSTTNGYSSEYTQKLIEFMRLAQFEDAKLKKALTKEQIAKAKRAKESLRIASTLEPPVLRSQVQGIWPKPVYLPRSHCQ